MKLALALILAPSLACATPQCGPSAEVRGVLASKYAEARQSAGLAANGALMELWASADGSWSLLLSSPRGLTCLIATGTSYEWTGGSATR